MVKSIVVIAIYWHTNAHMHANKVTCLLICGKISVEGFSTIQESISVLTYCAIHHLHGRYSHADKAQLMKQMLRAGVRNQRGGFEGLQGEVEA